MLISERRKKIVEIVNAEENISNKELSNRLNISEMTLWRDLKELESQGIEVIKIVSRLWGISPLCIVIAQI